MGHKVGGMVNLRIDRVYKGIGRLAMTSGTNNRNIYNGIITMMDDLQERGRLDDLKAIQLKHISPLEAYNKWKDGKLVGVGSVAFVKDLKTSLLDWVENYRVAETTRVGYKNNINQLLKVAKANASVADLPDTLRKYKANCLDSDTLRVFNHARVTCLAFARDQYGKNSELWRYISDINVVEYRKNRMNNPLTVKEVTELTSQMKPDVADMVWTMCTTGMGFKEYLDGFTVKNDHIIIHGEKNDHRHDRQVPIIRTPTPRILQYKRFREVIQEVRKDVTPYDFRRTYAVWLESAGVLRSHTEMYMGHSPKRMTDLYLIQDVTKYLKHDAKLVKDYITKEQKTK
jgi:integrase